MDAPPLFLLALTPTSWPHSTAPRFPAQLPPPHFARGAGRPLPPGLEFAYGKEAYTTHADIPPEKPKAWGAVRHHTRGIGEEFTEERQKSSLISGQPRWSGLHSLLTPPWVYVFLAFLYYLANGGYSG